MNEIVAACQFRDCIYIFCRNGDIYRMYVDDTIDKIAFSKIAELFWP